MAKAGDKRRLQEQSKKLQTLQIAIAIAVVVHVVFGLRLFRYTATNGQWIGFIFSTAVEFVCYNMLTKMAAPTFNSAGEILSGGGDFSQGAEAYFDAIYLSIIAQVGTIISKWFWLVLLAAPGYLVWQLWQNVLKPLLAARSPPASERTEAQQLKHDRAEKRQQRRMRY